MSQGKKYLLGLLFMVFVFLGSTKFTYAEVDYSTTSEALEFRKKLNILMKKLEGAFRQEVISKFEMVKNAFSVMSLGYSKYRTTKKGSEQRDIVCRGLYLHQKLINFGNLSIDIEYDSINRTDTKLEASFLGGIDYPSKSDLGIISVREGMDKARRDFKKYYENDCLQYKPESLTLDY